MKKVARLKKVKSAFEAKCSNFNGITKENLFMIKYIFAVGPSNVENKNMIIHQPRDIGGRIWIGS